jgi:hypothetical protein
MYFSPVFLTSSHDLLAVGDVRGHRHGAGDMLAGLERLDAHPTVIGNRRIDVHGVDLRVLEHRLEVRVALFDLKGIADGLELLGIALADGMAVRERMTLPDGDEFRPETEADDGDVELLL